MPLASASADEGDGCSTKTISPTLPSVAINDRSKTLGRDNAPVAIILLAELSACNGYAFVRSGRASGTQTTTDMRLIRMNRKLVGVNLHQEFVRVRPNTGSTPCDSGHRSVDDNLVAVAGVAFQLRVLLKIALH